MSVGMDVPIGTIVMWGGVDNCPRGWLLCDGSIYKQASYKALFAAIQHNFGGGEKSATYDPATDFYVPNLQGQFVRGVDGTASGSGDPDRASRLDMQTGEVVGPRVGSVQHDEVREHSHPYTSFPGGRGNIAGGRYWESGSSKTGSYGGAETRPRNAYLYFIIKAT